MNNSKPEIDKLSQPDNSVTLETRTQKQREIYDAFEKFIFSDDTKILAKLVARTLIFEQIINVPGDIIEAGVYRGSGMLTWLKLKKILAPNALKKVIGFDYFDTESLLNSLSGQDKASMKSLFEVRGYQHEEGAEKFVHDLIANAGFDRNSYDLVKGDISQVAQEFVDQRPGLKISCLYLDLDLQYPTYHALNAFWDRVSVGGMVVFDEYAYHQWSEARGADQFFEEKNIQIQALHYPCPTAYVIKH
ncbi:TylF/MycF/NovP-related O-methyltransferase [Limnoraphis robusta Tam1]|uniref:TylF/MycF/NovP-related O-methyltransferase n=1 Tax=Limnoraphis robusta CCNP1315 TaxID=3110306 RepID=A0ABU5U3T3_9CYAN|nr:TylF/MycF/NovP-related O-methyltransferase [Limnoraphis robusta]MEA5498931.1 TylF/MycF/NovP-related O-methyltransferase [Limnoraphis robusta BA-68 BA1]MEA5521836.1 TylF/MycF/NovP-related O-methyltransferase [Limnoraphis robusta CCNP1315]MEA5540465.1 TylF/MycF/NovP-related O-methyltransferase [Limnoraphis robusta Tam1]MEA5543968.1 TylF/MycF/NovP-related O-methyltransferase [Limnoraphis robusta CCNP1324]